MIPRLATPVWIGQPMATPCAWSTDTALVVAEFDVEHTGEGLAEMCRRIQRCGARRVAIERPDGPVVDALLHAELAGGGRVVAVGQGTP
jgi:hypothetical protein